MKERPILMSADMVRATLDGKKTMTRRIIKPQPFMVENTQFLDDCKDLPVWDWKQCEMSNTAMLCSCPYGWVKDQLWVRETFYATPFSIFYRATDEKPEGEKWKPSIFMPRKYSRIQLEITNIRVERLQDISANECLSEGVSSTEFWKPKELNDRPFEEKWWDDFHFWSNYPQIVYKSLWESINGAGAWDKNPWVWVVEFERIKP